MALLKLLSQWVSSGAARRAPFPDHIWARHSALLVAARDVAKQHGKV